MLFFVFHKRLSSKIRGAQSSGQGPEDLGSEDTVGTGRNLRQEDCYNFQVSPSDMKPCPKMDG